MTSPSSSTPRVQLRFAVVLFLVLCAAGARFVPYLVSDDSVLKPLLWNFSPVVAIALFGGRVLRQDPIAEIGRAHV